MPPLVTVRAHDKVRDAVALLHEHRVSQLPVVSTHDPHAVVGSVGERGLLKHAVEDSSLLNADVVDVMEPPFPAVAADDAASEAVAAPRRRARRAARHRRRPAAGRRHPRGPARGARAVRPRGGGRHVLDDGPERPAPLRHPRGPRGPEARPDVRVGHPGDPPDLDVRAARARPVRRGLRLLALAATRPARALEDALGELEGGLGTAFSSGMAATHALLTAATSAGDHVILPERPLRRDLPPRRQGPQPLRPRSTTWSTRPTSTP